MVKLLQKLLLMAALLCVPWVTQAQTPGDLVSTFPYSCDFESTSVTGSWVTVNGTQENGWYIGTATNATTSGSQALYVSNNSGTSNAYSVNVEAASYSWAYQRFTFAAATYNISFTWKCVGEISGDPYDFFRVFVVPDTVTLTAGTLPSTDYTWSNDFMSDVPDGWIGVNGTTTYFVDQSTYTTLNTEFVISSADNYKLVFLWLNDDNTCNNPPAAVDDISISVNTCPRPLTLTATSSDNNVVFDWVDNNNSTWDLVYGTAGFNPDTATVITVNDTTYTATNLASGYYEAYVRANCGNTTSNWRGPVEFNYGIIYMNMAVSGSDTIRSCNAIIYDDGGPDGEYSANCQSTLVIYPADDQHALQISGQSYTESTYDYLRIYDGLSTSSTPLFDDYGVSATQTFGPFVTTDPVTVVFHSDPSVFYNGFEINVSCLPLPDCARPLSFVVDSTSPTSVSFSWTDTENSNWVIVYGPAGFQISDTSAEAYFTTTSGTISNLDVNTEYDFYLMSVCTGENSLSRSLTVRTDCVPLTAADLPYTYGFEGTSTGSSATIDACWHKGTNYTSSAYPYPSASYAHSGNRSLYFYTYSGTYSYAVLPRYVDSVNTLQMTFWSSTSSTTYNGIITAGVMTDPEDINTFTPVKVCVPENSTQLTLFEVNFDQYTGNGEYIALLAQITPQHTYNYDYIYLDDVTLQPLPTCGHVENLTVAAATTSTAMVTWDVSSLGEYNEAQIDYWNSEDNTWTSVTTTEDFYLFEDLTPGTNYIVRVTEICSNNDSSSYEEVSFSTNSLGCLEADLSTPDTVYTSNSTSGISGCIAYSAWGNTAYQTIWTAAELTNLGLVPGPITAIDLGFTSSTYSKELTIFLGNTTTTTINSGNLENPNNFLQVYGPESHPSGTSGWQHYDFDTTFVWDGTSSIIMTTFMNQPSDASQSSSSGLTGYYESAPNKARFRYKDSNPFTLSDYNSGTASSTYSYRAAVRFYGFDCLTTTSCSTPGVWVESLSNDTAYIGIIPGAEESEWDVYISLEGDSMIYVGNASDMIYPIGDLNPASNYVVRVENICNGDTLATEVPFQTECGLVKQLPIVMDFENVNTGSYTAPFTVRCWNRLTNATSYPYVYVTSGSSYNHTDNGNQGIYWYRASSSTSDYGNYQAVVLPQIDTTAIPLNSTMLTFWAKPSSTTYNPTLYVGFISNIDSVVYDTVDNFVYYDTIHVANNTNWQKFTVMFDRYDNSANCSYVAIRANYEGDYWYVYVDDIRLDSIPDCSPIEDLTVKAGPVSAIMQWTTVGTNYTGADVNYRIVGSDSWTSVQVLNDRHAVLTGLTPDTTYQVRVSAICDDENSVSVSSTFKTTGYPCSVYDATSYIDTTVGIGSTSTSNYIPSYSFYSYGYSQQIFTPSEIGGAASIQKITVYPQTVTQQRIFEIYLGHTTETSLSSGFVNPSDMTLVYNGGAITMTADQPLEFNLTTPFDYNGSQNLVVTFRDITGSYVSGNYFYTASASDGAARYVYQDGDAYTPGSVSGGTALSSRNVMNFFGGVCLQASTCSAPLAMVTNVTTTSVTVNWAPGAAETQWVVYYRLSGDDTWTFADTANVNNYTFTNLMSGTPYDFKVEGVCTDVFANEVSAVTLCAEISTFPYNENFDSWGTGSGVLPQCWFRTGSYSSYTYISPNANYSGSNVNHSGTNGGSIYMYSSTGTYQSNLIMPAIDTTVVSMNQLQVTFRTTMTSTSYAGPAIAVGVVSDPNDFNTFVPLDTVYHSDYINEWELFEVSLANYADSGNRIAFRTVYPGAYTYFYLDDITVELIPDCQRPDGLQASNPTTSSVDLSWNERGNATQWQIEYGPVGFTPGTGAGTVVTVNTNPYSLSNLPSSYQADFYVKSVCSSTESSEYSRIPGRISLKQIPATLPYDYDFESAAEWANWQTASNQNNDWYRGVATANGGSYSMYVSGDNGTTYSPYVTNCVVNAAAYRDIDFGPIDSSYTMTFDARAGGTLTAAYDGLMVFLVDTAGTPESHSFNITSPWGSVNDLYRIASVRIDTTWQTYTCSFDTISGVHRVAFFWFNQNTSYATLPEPAAVDNIHIDYSSCPRPVATQVVSVGSTTANLTWTGISNANYEVIYRPYPNGDSNYIAYTNTNSITLTDLEPVTQYAVWVRRDCGSDDQSLTSDGITFRTSLCENSFVAQNFTSNMTTTTSYYSPLGYATYDYSYIQMIVDSADLAGMQGGITAFAFDPANTTSSDFYTHMTVYMANVSEVSLGNGFILPDATHVFEKVINDRDLSFTETGYQIVGLDTTFNWDGHSNILVSFNRQHGDWSSSTSFNAHTHPGSDYKMRYYYRDGTPFDHTNVSGGYTSTDVGDLYLISCGGATCDEPTDLSVTNVTYNSATLNWVGTADSYELQYKASTDLDWVDSMTLTTTTYDLGNLNYGASYLFRVRAICDADEDLMSDWVEFTFTTDSLPCFAPTAMQNTAVDLTTATFDWTVNGEENAWRIYVWNATFNQSYDVTSHPATISGLTQTTSYYATVVAVCGGGLLESETSDTVQFTTATCQPVTNVAVSNITTSSATVSWSGSAQSYSIEYGMGDFEQGNGTQIDNITGTSYTIQGLTDDRNYSVYVRANCDAANYSVWSDRVQFRTEAVGIADVEGVNLTIYPNPTSDNTTIALSGVSGEVTITIVDLSGRTVKTDSMSCEGDCVKTVAVSGLAEGAYFVRVSGENVNMVKKLVVK